MNSIARVLVIVLVLIAGLLPGLGGAQNASRDPAQTMRELRATFLSSSAASLGLSPTKEFPRVFGVAMDWPVGDDTATIVSAMDGTASLYTTSTFGIIGGDAHAAVRAAAQRFVTAAESHLSAAAPTSSYPYPEKGKIRFYLRTFQEVRVIETDAASAYSSSGAYSGFFRAGQAVVTELRKVVEARR
jgi:hypothetical protein